MDSPRRAGRAGLLGLAVLAVGCGSLNEPAVADRDCTDFPSQAAAQRSLDAHPSDPDHLDGDGNGIACESMHRASKPAAATRRARVLTVVDGDTIKVRATDGGSETVRLVGIDTPESKRPQTPVECGAKRAASAMRALVTGTTVTLRRDPTQDAIDKYGRTLGYVDLGKRDVGEAMVRSGWAKPYVYAGVPFARVDAYRAAEKAAARARAGVFGSCSGDFHRRA